MFFSSYTEFILISSFIILFNLLSRVFPAYLFFRSLLLLSGSALILSTIIDKNTMFILFLLMSGTYVIGKILEKKTLEVSFRKKLLFSALSFLLLLFCIRNYSWIGTFFSAFGLAKSIESISIVGRVGLSYILFRLLHFLVDAFRGKIYRLDYLVFLNYIFFFPTYLSGPIDRYNNFSYWLRNRRFKVSVDLFVQGSARVFIGVIKKLFLVPLIVPYVSDLSMFDFIVNKWEIQLILSVLAYSFYIYFDFSGYSDIAIGSAYMLGIKSPENFNNPYISRDIAEFWKRWHISFSSILGEYIFKPVVVFLSKSFSHTPRLTVSIVGYLFTFVICGLWHGSTLNFVYWGLWHGIGLSIFKIWEKFSGGIYSKMYYSVIRKFASITLTFFFVSMGWYFFKTDTTEIHNLIKNKIGLVNQEYDKPNEQELVLQQGYWKNFGYGISVTYQTKGKSGSNIQFKKINDITWIDVAMNRDAKHNFIHIHGEVKYGNDKRNLAPGLYVVRYQPVGDKTWIGDIVMIDNYMKSEK